MSSSILFISAGMLKNKKKIQIDSLYLNYGFLGLASLVNQKLKKVNFFQANLFSPEDFFNKLEEKSLVKNTKYPIFISIPSFFAITWTQEFITILKNKFPNKKIIIGGRWVLDSDIWVKEKFPLVDVIVKGQAENIIEKLVTCNFEGQIVINEDAGINIDIPKLNYNILDNFIEYSPSIELSRGCGKGCSFCADKDVKLSSIKPADKVISEILDLIKLYDDKKLNFYFESSIFQPSNLWIDEFNFLYQKNNLEILWRCETRVDTFSSKKIKQLFKSGLRVIDLGLESASETQLKRMGKTSNPSKYLLKASELLKICYEENIWVKVNILLYPGESNATINETIDWLNNHRKYIKGISAYPLILYGTSLQTLSFFNSLKDIGATLKDGALSDTGITYLNLSDEISYDKSLEIAKMISKLFMTQEDYYDLKKFNYFPRTYTYKDFVNSINLLDKNELTFN